jgi:hypothetical protein
MSPTSEGWPTEPAYLGVSIQRAQLGDEPVPAEWLERPDLVEQAERLDRLAADFDLVTTLSLAGFEGGDWDYFEQELAKYGIAVTGGWLRTGLIFSRYAARGFGGLPEMSRDFEPDEIEELTYETVSKALFHFRRDVLMKHAWDYRKGATLRTFFVGQCLSRFSNIYRRWWGNEARNNHLLADDEDLVRLGPRRDGVDQRAVDGILASDLLAGIKDPRVRAAMRLTAAGRSQAEIGGILGVTEKAVERMLYNERVRLKKRMAG